MCQQLRCLTLCSQSSEDIQQQGGNDIMQTVPQTLLCLALPMQASAVFAALDHAFPEGLDPRASTRMLSRLSKGYSLDLTLFAFAWHAANKYELNYYHYSAVINACTRACRWEKALQLVGA
eukprot:TRINITY_DN36429_c0_g1_i1.p1 TRINITY_DN36429_c0_g1~~TRINITY_DN36429_c0_g1_i1.p1  ORF type:complete len:121 (-),score=15.66 TRINITY_DN36429_c0_g1_i1:4-366(-)